MKSIISSRRGSGRACVLALLVALLLASPLSATWSILIVDTATGEVALGIATCLTFFDLRPNTVVVVPGFGVAAAQSFVGPLNLRQTIRSQLLAGTDPTQILAMLASSDPGHQSRQYGIVDTQGRASTFTGVLAGAFASGLTGQAGSLVYAIQGNVLTGLPVIQNAQIALVNTPGDVGEKLMAAMVAARLMGGVGVQRFSDGSPCSRTLAMPRIYEAFSRLTVRDLPGRAEAAEKGRLVCVRLPAHSSRAVLHSSSWAPPALGG